jgi:hypothetical protein
MVEPRKVAPRAIDVFAFTPVPRIAWLLVVLVLHRRSLAAARVDRDAPAPPEPVRPGAQRRDRMSHDGDIYGLDPVTHAERLIDRGTSFDFGPTFSRDGTKLCSCVGRRSIDARVSSLPSPTRTGPQSAN